MQVQGVTISVSDLARSRAFYEEVLGFVPDGYYAPTRWLPFKLDGRAFFAIVEVPDLRREPWLDIVNFHVDDVEALWERVRGRAEVEDELGETPWGSFKFVVRDPDGWRLGFVGKR